MKIIRPTLKYIEAWLTAFMMTTVLATMTSTSRVMAALEQAGMEASFYTKLSVYGYDLVHFATVYGVFIAIALLIAFIVSSLIGRRWANLTPWAHMAAGFVALTIMLYLMERSFFGVPFVAGARDNFGVFLQGACGAIGGAIYAYLISRPAPPPPDNMLGQD